MEAIFAGPWGPVLIFCLRIIDVSLSTLRILLAVRNQRALVPIVGIFEVTVWIFAVGSAIQNLGSIWHLLGYAGGFAAGSVIGMWIEEKLAIGLATMRVITRRSAAQLADSLRAMGCGVTEFVGQGREGKVEVLHTVLPRRRIRPVLAEIERLNPEAFVTVEEPREIVRGWMQNTPRRRSPAGLGANEILRQTAALLDEEFRSAEAHREENKEN